MITYVYKAKDLTTGDEVSSEVQADSERSAAKLLVAQNLFPIDINPKEGAGLLANKFSFITNRVKAKERVIFSRQLATLINAGLPVSQSLRTVRNQVSNKHFQTIIDGIIVSVEGGSTLASAFGNYPEAFNQIFVALIAAGEASGTLDKNLERLAAQLEKDEAILRKVRGALVYPVIVLAVIVLVLIFMLVTVVPQVKQVYVDLKKDLPIYTKILIWLSDFTKRFWFLVFPALGLSILGLRNYFKTEQGEAVADKFKLKAPLFGPLFEKLYMARFSRTLSTLLSSGIPVLQALETVKFAVNNVHVEAAIDRASQEVKGGKALSLSLETEETFTSLVPQMISIGEASGAVDDMLAKVATFYEEEVDQEVKNLSTTIEPLLMVVLAVIIGLVIMAILFPVYNLVGSGIA